MNQPQHGIKTVMLAPQTVTDAATVTANLDTDDCAYVSIDVALSAEETTHAANSTLSLLQSDDTVVSNFATVVADQSLDLTNAKMVRYEIDKRGKKRYLRLSFTAGTITGGNVTVAAIATKHRNRLNPSSTTEMQASTNDTVVIT